MGFYIRKSKSFGPFRLNFSKSGIGVSTGVKGARVSFSPKGTYVNLGRSGLYYRQKIGGSSSKNAKTQNALFDRQGHKSPTCDASYSYTEPVHTPQEGFKRENGTCKQISKDIRRAWFWKWLCVVLLVIFTYASITSEPVLIVPMLVVAVIWFFAGHVTYCYDLNEGTLHEWEKFMEVLSLLKNSKKVWMIAKDIRTSDAKHNAGATRTVTRKRAFVKRIGNRKTFGCLKTNVPSIVVKSSKVYIRFLPNILVVGNGGRRTVHTYDTISLYCSTTDFVETGAVPSDATVVRHTWQYVNKDGTADLRYSKNPQFPVCRYGVLQFTSPDGMCFELHVSNYLIAENIGNAFRYYKTHLNDFSFRDYPADGEMKQEEPLLQVKNKVTKADNDQTNLKKSKFNQIPDANDQESEEHDPLDDDFYRDLFGENDGDAKNGKPDSDDNNDLFDDMSMFLDGK